MRRRPDSHHGATTTLHLNVRCGKCGVRGLVECAPHELVETLAAMHTLECQAQNGVLAFERICAKDGCDNGAAAGRDYCGTCR
jgi:hypothetical protein